MKPKARLILGLVAIAAFAVLGLMNFKQSMTPYVSFAEAMTMERTVQVAGFPDHQSAGFDSEKAAFTFTMKDETGESMNVVYFGGKPGNFDQASSVVVIGDYAEGSMTAKQLLVKCPSKYEGEEQHIGGAAQEGDGT